jgi:TrpR family transcriptional regulator, trp operon repressor
MIREDKARWYKFLEHCLNFKNKEELEVFFNVMFTASEKIEFGNRLAIMKDLLNGQKTQREIAQDLEVSIANISRGSNVIKNSEVDLKVALKI